MCTHHYKVHVHAICMHCWNIHSWLNSEHICDIAYSFAPTYHMVFFHTQLACREFFAFDGPEAEETMWLTLLDMQEEDREQKTNEVLYRGRSAVDRYLDKEKFDPVMGGFYLPNETYSLFNCSVLEHDVRGMGKIIDIDHRWLAVIGLS